MSKVICWISPFDEQLQTVDDVVRHVQPIKDAGHDAMVLLPTLYGRFAQEGLTRTLGAELAIDSIEDAAVVRARIEARGFKCGGWSVPRAIGDIAEEAALHGQVAASFEYFVINLEVGWQGFWTEDGGHVVDLWLGSFWAHTDAQKLNGNVGLTVVTNTAMMSALSDEEALAWTGGTNFDCPEAYIVGDPGLDPHNALRIWRQRLDRIGAPADRPIVLILERGDLPSMVAEFDTGHGVQIWTLQIAAATSWPALGTGEPETPVVDEAWQARKSAVTNAVGYVTGDLVSRIRKSTRSSSVRGACDEIQSVLQGAVT